MLFQNAHIFLPEGRFAYGSFSVEDGRFTRISVGSSMESGVDLNGAYVIPGLVDIHTHGSRGGDFSDGDGKGLLSMGQYLLKNGISSFAPASMTLPYGQLEKAFVNGLRFHKENPQDAARLMGIHMEGPFFSYSKRGAQNPDYLQLPDINAFTRLYEVSEGLLRIADVAAELEGAVAFTQQASRLCTVSLAHSDASYEEACRLYDSGASHLTHLFNAMAPIHHRKPGPIAAASERDHVMAELICDGKHVHESAVRLAFKLFPGRICLVSDSLRCCGMPSGAYTLGGQAVFLQDHVAALSDGTLAGSATNLYECMLKAVSFGIPKETALLSATAIPAKQIGREKEIGAIAPGCYGDFVVTDSKLNRQYVYKGGQRLPY